MQNDEIILQLVKEIHSGQKSLVEKVNILAVEQATIKADLIAGRNGYEPHEIVDILHWAEKKIKEEDKETSTVKDAFIKWFVPVISSTILMGLMMLLMHK